MDRLIFTFLLTIMSTSVIAVYFECEYFYRRLGPVLGDRYGCHAIPQGGLSDPYVRGITGEHQAGHDNSHVIGFQLYNQSSVYLIPRGLKEFFPNMLSLAVLNCSLIQLFQDDLAGYGNIQALSLRQNYIERIPLGFYEHVPNLLSTNMLENRISQVGPNILAPLTRLTSANFLNNICVSMHADITNLHELQNILNTNCPYHGN